MINIKPPHDIYFVTQNNKRFRYSGRGSARYTLTVINRDFEYYYIREQEQSRAYIMITTKTSDPEEGLALWARFLHFSAY